MFLFKFILQQFYTMPHEYDSTIYDLTGSDLADLLNKSIESNLTGNINNTNITDIQRIDNYIFITYLTYRDTQPIQGVMCSNRLNTGEYQVVLNEWTEVKINNKPFSIYKFTGTTLGRIKQNIKIITGHINDSNIGTIYVVYPSNEITGLVLNENQETFTDIKIGLNSWPEEIIASSRDRDLVYKYSF